jgi:UTP--glucose-1-phosphate uridylyltransferase
VFEKYRTPIIALEEVAAEKVSRYGIVGGKSVEPGILRVETLVEKPKPEEAPSRYAICARYILTAEIFACLDETKPGKGGEIQLTDAMAKLIGKQPFHALTVEAVRHDCGDKAGFVIANLAIALGREDLEPKVRDAISRL